MYFDHASCSSCGARFAPESVKAGGGGAGRCPACGAQLRLKDLFGVVDSMVEPDQEHVTMDDLVSAPKATPPRRPTSAPRASEPDPVTRNVLDMLAEIRRERGG